MLIGELIGTIRNLMSLLREIALSVWEAGFRTAETWSTIHLTLDRAAHYIHHHTCTSYRDRELMEGRYLCLRPIIPHSSKNE